MNSKFAKYQGTGNDFVLIDNRHNIFPKENTSLIKRLCDRRFGIGADGLLLLENDLETDFRMVYYNSDGNESSMCGNGGRCLVAYAKKLNVVEGNEIVFNAIDGLHHASLLKNGLISLQMKDVTSIKIEKDYIFMNTGSPHHVMMVESLIDYDVKGKGAEIRYSSLYGAAGSNVNFVKQEGDAHFALRTYERGVEDETLSCGTGATATAIAMYALGKTVSNHVELTVEGGTLEVSFDKNGDVYCNVFLQGPAKFVFEGEFTW